MLLGAGFISDGARCLHNRNSGTIGTCKPGSAANPVYSQYQAGITRRGVFFLSQADLSHRFPALGHQKQVWQWPNPTSFRANPVWHPYAEHIRGPGPWPGAEEMPFVGLWGRLARFRRLTGREPARCPSPTQWAGPAPLTPCLVLMTRNTGRCFLASGPWAYVVPVPSCRPTGVLRCSGVLWAQLLPKHLPAIPLKSVVCAVPCSLGTWHWASMCSSAISVSVPVRAALSPRVTNSFLWTLSYSSFFSNFRVRNL